VLFIIILQTLFNDSTVCVFSTTAGTFTEMYSYCTCSIIMELVSPILFYNIYNDCMNNDTVKLSVACCVCIVMFQWCFTVNLFFEISFDFEFCV